MRRSTSNGTVSPWIAGVVLGCWIPWSLPAHAFADPESGTHYETWSGGSVRGVAVLAPDALDRDCVLQMVGADGGVCGTTVVGPIGASPGGPLIWACRDGGCAGPNPQACSDPADPLHRLILLCDEATEFELTGPHETLDPPSAALSVRGDTATSSEASFVLVPTLYSGSAVSLPLCALRVAAHPGDDASTVSARAAAAIRRSAACAAAGLSAEVAPQSGELRLEAPGAEGTQLVPGYRVAPGASGGRCYSLTDLGVPQSRQALALSIRWSTSASGAAAGELTIVERSDLGNCAVTVSTSAGQSAESVASAVYAAFSAASEGCAPASNPRDVGLDGSRNTTLLASTLEICSDDPGVGFEIAPEGAGGIPPIALCQDTSAECFAGEGQMTLDASASSDPDGSGVPMTFDWYRDYGTATEQFLGSGELLDYSFPLGLFDVSVVVTDETGLQDVGDCVAHVVDTQPPVVVAGSAVTPSLLFPPNHELVDVHAAVNTSDDCGSTFVKLVSITSSEPDDAPGTDDGATLFDVQDALTDSEDYDFRLRAERDRNGGGRTYEVSYEVRDDTYNATMWTADVTVPVDLGGVVDSIALSLGKIHSGDGTIATVLDWTDDGTGAEFDVIRGDLGNVISTPQLTYLGSAECVQTGTSDPHYEDTTETPAGETSYYLVDAFDGADRIGVSTEPAALPRDYDGCPAGVPPAPIPDPERNSTVHTNWGWRVSITQAELNNQLAQYGERLVDIDRLGPDEYLIVQVKNAGDPYWWPAFYWKDQDVNGVTAQLQAVNGRILDLEPFLVNGQTHFTVSIIPNTGKRAKGWAWNYDLTAQQVLAEINSLNMRLIDVEAYEKGGQTLYAYAAISNTGVDQVTWVPYFSTTLATLSNDLVELGGRLIDIEVLPDGNLAAILVQNDGSAWWWGVGYTGEQVATVVASEEARLVDLEQYDTADGTRYAFVAIDDARTAESRRLRAFLDAEFGDPSFGGPVQRGLLVKEVNGPVIAELGARQRFQPASTLKLLPYLYAIQEIDAGNATLDGSSLTMWGDTDDPGDACLLSGSATSPTYRNALPTMMWYSHNMTLQAFFRQYPPYDPNSMADTLTFRAQNQWGMPDTEMYDGCTGSPPDWLMNRSTLFDIASLYEGVESGAFFNSMITPVLFWNNLINQMQGDCMNFPVGDANCSCPIYYQGCPGNYYQSPYVTGGAGPSTVGFLGSVVQQEGPSVNSTVFLNQILIRQKGGGASVPGYPVAGFADGYRSMAMHVTLPFKNGSSQIVPKTYVVETFVNNWDATCGTGSLNPTCNGLIGASDQLMTTLWAEALRVPLRRALATW